MHAHSSHLLQPLDAGVFSVLKRVYGRTIENWMRNGINHIDKDDFLSIYPSTRAETFTIENIKAGFAATGVIPWDPKRVISKLNIRLHTSTPRPSSASSGNWTPKTPYNIKTLNRQSTAIKRVIREASKHPLRPFNPILTTPSKGTRQLYIKPLY
jgi:hypothetical protein